VIEVGGLTLRAPRAEDVAWIFDACQDIEIQRYTRVPSPYRAGDAVAFLEMAGAARADGSAFHFVITLTETGELMGAVAVSAIDRNNRTAELGFWLAMEGRGRGIATQAVAGVVKWAAKTLGLVLMSALVAEGNTPSEKVMQRNGFTCMNRDARCAAGMGEVDASLWLRAFGPN
jgi:RimJ/RimL family protein N-acetyltransferase